jgi:hypothetical protein
MQSELAQAAALLAAEFPDAPRSMLESALRENDLDIPSARRRLLEMLEQEKRGASGAYSSSRVRPGCWINQKDGRLASSSIQPAHTAPCCPPPLPCAVPPIRTHWRHASCPPPFLFISCCRTLSPWRAPHPPRPPPGLPPQDGTRWAAAAAQRCSTLLPLSWWPLAPCSA